MKAKTLSISTHEYSLRSSRLGFCYYLLTYSEGTLFVVIVIAPFRSKEVPLIDLAFWLLHFTAVWTAHYYLTPLFFTSIKIIVLSHLNLGLL